MLRVTSDRRVADLKSNTFSATGFLPTDISAGFSIRGFEYDTALPGPPPAPAPEPAAWAMLLLGFGAIGVRRRRRPAVVG